jgi:hypothetical protein
LTQDESGERLRVEARFLLDGTGGPELAFLDSELLLPPTSHEDCMLAAAAGGGAAGSRGGPGWVAGACLLGLGVATVVVAITVFKSRRRGAGAAAGGSLREMMRFRRRGRRGVGGGASNTGMWPAVKTKLLRVKTFISTFSCFFFSPVQIASSPDITHIRKKLVPIIVNRIRRYKTKRAKELVILFFNEQSVVRTE